MKKLLTLLAITFTTLTYAQNKTTNQILEEGKLLFRLEKASWYGTDDMLARFPEKRDSIGGYLSYENLDGRVNNIFYSRFDPNYILVRYEFDIVPLEKPIKIDSINHQATEIEKNLITIRIDATKRLYANEDKTFKFYENTSNNIIPLILNNQKVVFILTASTSSDYILIGNDYKLTYNDKNEFVKTEKIHESLLNFAYKFEDPEIKTTSTMHSHVLSDYISSTDICTLLLYKDFLDWNQHIVVSKNWVSIFNMENQTLFTVKTKAWKKMAEDQEKRNK